MKTDRELLELAASKKEAIAAGANRFFTGKPCKRGHISEDPIQWAQTRGMLL